MSEHEAEETDELLPQAAKEQKEELSQEVKKTMVSKPQSNEKKPSLQSNGTPSNKKPSDDPLPIVCECPPEDTENPEQRKESAEEDGRCPEFFGVRSYLHTFYEAVTVKNPQAYDEDASGEPEYRYLIQNPRKRRRASAFWWKVCLWTGANLLIFGALVLLVAYAYPRRVVVVGQREDAEIIDKTALAFNQNLDLCKIVGLVLFCMGGAIAAAALLLPGLSATSGCGDVPDVDEGSSFRVKVAVGEEDPPLSPTDRKIPATEELTSVQPKLGHVQEMMVMTNSGLCKVPVE